MEDSAGSDRFDRQWKSNGKRRKNCDHTVEEETAMKVLIVGSGGREHAIAASAAKSSKVEKMYCAPGNAGIEEFAECVPIGAMEFEKLVAFAKEKSIDLCIVGMDDLWWEVLWMRWKQPASAHSDQERMQRSWRDPKRFQRTDEEISYSDSRI